MILGRVNVLQLWNKISNNYYQKPNKSKFQNASETFPNKFQVN